MKRIIISIIFISILGLCENTFALIKSQNLIFGSRLEGNAYNYVGNTTGTVTGAVTSTGSAGAGYYFDGTDDYIQYGRLTQLEGTTTEYTICISVKLTEITQNHEIFAYDQNASLGGEDIYLFWHSTGVLLLETGSSAEKNTNITSLSDGAWHRIAFVKTSTNILVYDNGVLRYNVAKNGGTFGSNFSFYFGFVAITWRGSLDEVLIYSRALTAAEVRQDMLLLAPGE